MGLGAMIKKGKGNLLQKTALAVYNFHVLCGAPHNTRTSIFW